MNVAITASFLALYSSTSAHAQNVDVASFGCEAGAVSLVPDTQGKENQALYTLPYETQPCRENDSERWRDRCQSNIQVFA
jgi:hypothetical protein